MPRGELRKAGARRTRLWQQLLTLAALLAFEFRPGSRVSPATPLAWSRSTVNVWSLARATTFARGENASRRESHANSVIEVSASNTRLTRRIRFLFLSLTLMVPQNGRERPDQAGADRLSAEPAEPEGERHRAPHVRFELHRLEGHLQAR